MLTSYRPFRLLTISLVSIACSATVNAGIVFDNLDAHYGQGGFEQTTGGQQVGASIVTGSVALNLDRVSMGGTLPPGDGIFFAIYARVNDGSFNDGTLGSLLFETTVTPTWVETKPADQFNPARGTTTLEMGGAFKLQANTGYWFVLGSTIPDPTTGPIQWAYTYSTDYTTEYGATFPSPGDLVTYFSGTVPDPDPTDLGHYFPLSDGPQLLRIEASPVPEPSSLIMLGSALFVFPVTRLVARRADRQK